MKRGFTLIEVIVTLSIISILSVIVFANYRLGEKKYILESETQKLISNLRKGQNMALAPTVLKDYKSGVGMHFETGENNDKYFFFLDKGGNKKPDGGDEITETINLPANLHIKSLLPTGDKIDIFFEPPDPTIYINNETGVSKEAVIILEYKNGDNVFNKSVKVKATGLIEEI